MRHSRIHLSLQESLYSSSELVSKGQDQDSGNLLTVPILALDAETHPTDAEHICSKGMLVIVSTFMKKYKLRSL